MKPFFIQLEAKRIHVPNSRWYEIGDYNKTKLAYPSVTSVLQVKSKQGLENWKTQIAKSGIDPKELGQKMMDEGSAVHDAAEQLMSGSKIEYSDQYDFWGEWLPICRFVEAYHELKINPILIEQTIWSNRMQVAGTLDLFCTLTLPKATKSCFAIVDLKRSASAYTDYQWQISAYKDMLLEMISKPDTYSKRLLTYLKDKMEVTEDGLIQNIVDTKPAILLLNVATKKGWRLTEIEYYKEKLKGFEACNTLFRIEHPNLDYMRETYPTELSLNLNI